MMRLVASLFSFIVLVSLHVPGFAQFSYPALPEAGKAQSDWVPVGWKVKLHASGDLNADGVGDIAAILESEDQQEHPRGCGREGDTSFAVPRILIVLLGETGEGYRLAATENKLVLRADEGGIFGDPLADLRIERGTLVLHHYGGSAWRWAQTYRFRLQDDGWFLIGYTDYSAHNISHYMREYDYNPLTGKVKITTRGEDGKAGCRRCFVGENCPKSARCRKDEIPASGQETWHSLGKRPLIALNDTYCALAETKILPFVPWK